MKVDSGTETTYGSRLKEQISQHYPMERDTNVEYGKHSMVPPPPKKSFVDSAPNRMSRIIDDG
jgi:hypothetical protein